MQAIPSRHFDGLPQNVSGSRDRDGCALRHCSNRCFRCNKSSGIAVFVQDMPHPTTHCEVESRTLAESSQRHYLSKRSRSQKSILVFLAQDAESHVFCYSKADLLKRDPRPMRSWILSSFGKRPIGELPPELVFDSELTTYAKLNRLNQMGITFMTLRRGSPGILREVANTPRSAWRTVHLDVPHRMYQTPKVVDQKVALRNYEGPIRQMLITDLGHEEPTVLLTNDLRSSAAKRITRYAQRMLIENGLADAVEFFHLDALSSAVRLKIDFDVTLTEVASGLYRMPGRRLHGYEAGHSRQLFRHLLNTRAEVEITDKRVEVTLPKRAHNPLLIAAGFAQRPTAIPWWGGRALGPKVSVGSTKMLADYLARKSRLGQSRGVVMRVEE